MSSTHNINQIIRTTLATNHTVLHRLSGKMLPHKHQSSKIRRFRDDTQVYK